MVSAVSDTTFQQMVAYQRTLGNYAFDTYRNALNAMTLNAAMGDYLNMVNNVKATATTSPNENYAREFMQLFTLGVDAAPAERPRGPGQRQHGSRI